MSLKETALRVAVLATLTDKVKATLAQARREQADAMGEVGAAGVNVELADGRRVAKVALVAGRVSAQVADEKDLLEWVQANYPDQVETVVRVRDGFRQRLLTDAANKGAPVDPVTGEVVPGIGIRTGAPYVSTSGLQRDVIEAAWRDGSIQLLDFVELPAIEGA